MASRLFRPIVYARVDTGQRRSSEIPKSFVALVRKETIQVMASITTALTISKQNRCVGRKKVWQGEIDRLVGREGMGHKEKRNKKKIEKTDEKRLANDRKQSQVDIDEYTL